jgi:hypothetical protein
MNSEELKIFQNITFDYFAKMAPDAAPPALEEAYLLFEKPILLDYTSLVTIAGAYEGCLCLTVSAGLVGRLLQLHGEPKDEEAVRLDMCRELSNILSGNANRAFGENWSISVPQTYPSDGAEGRNFPGCTFVMPFSWNGSAGCLVIGLERKKGGG